MIKLNYIEMCVFLIVQLILHFHKIREIVINLLLVVKNSSDGDFIFYSMQTSNAALNKQYDARFSFVWRELLWQL